MNRHATAPAPAVYDSGRVLVGHNASTGEPIDYVARTDRRACNGVITGAIGSGKTTVAEHVVTGLEGTGRWTRRWVRAEDRDPQVALDVLTEAEQRMVNRDPLGRLHLVVWDDFHALVRDPDLRATGFAGRVRELAKRGPNYGVAQLVVVRSTLLPDFGNDSGLRAVLVDNVIALRNGHRAEQIHVAGATVCPGDLPRGCGHAYVLVPGPDGRTFAHAHLDVTGDDLRAHQAVIR